MSELTADLTGVNIDNTLRPKIRLWQFTMDFLKGLVCQEMQLQYLAVQQLEWQSLIQPKH